MCDNPDAFRRHFAEIVARGPVKAKASAKKAGKPKGKKK
jgi:predicted ArsR family transcriptional regulator